MARRTRKGPEEPTLFDAPAPREARAAAAEPSAAPPEEPAFTVSELTARIKGTLGGFGKVRVEGELSSLRRASSGHLYFDLKDDAPARISCAIWRSQVGRALRFDPEEGMQVVAHGRLDVYAPRGSYSLIVERLEPRGIGALLARLERLKEELKALGRFDRQRPLPRMPRKVGIVTSRDGAALRDFLRTRSLRWPGYPLRLCHAAVQGPGSAADIAAAVAALDRSGVDVIVVCRGGGSLEDLWSFNERVVADAIWAASVPVVSGVGHESDTTLADLVADHRAHTPTDAAQTVLPDRAQLVAALARSGRALAEAFEERWYARTEALERLAGRPVLRDAGWILDERARALAGLQARLRGSFERTSAEAGGRLRGLLARLERQSPRARVERWLTRVMRAHERLRGAGLRTLEAFEQRFAARARELDAISPLRVLGRGYSVTRRAGAEAPLRDSAEVAVGEVLETRLARGSLRSTVTEKEPGTEPGT